MVPDALRNGSAAATPFLDWKHRRGDSAAGPVPPLSARKLAASLSHHLVAGGTVITWQCGLSSDRLGFQFRSSLEGATKWDCYNHFQSNVKLTTPAASSGEAEFFKFRKQVNEVEADGGRSRTKFKYRTRKTNQERELSMTTEHQKMCLVINNLAKNVKKERKICKNIDKMNSNLLRDIAEAKLSARKFILNLENERRAREKSDCLCYDLVREMEARKAGIGALRNQQKRIQLEVDEERKMLQLAEVWREEQAQMKLADAKLILEDKYAEIRDLIDDLRAFFRGNLKSAAGVDEASKAEVLRQAFELINFRSGKDFELLNPESDRRFTNIKDSRTMESERRHEEAHCASSITEIRGDESRTTYMSNCNAESNRNARQKSEGSEICSTSLMQPKPRSEGTSMLINGSSNRRSVSAVSRAGRNPHVVRAMKGHIEWPWPIRRDSLPMPGNLVEPKLGNEKMLVRNVLKHKM